LFTFAPHRNDHELIQVRVVDLEIALEDEVSEKRRLERELKQKGRENQAAIAAVSLTINRCADGAKAELSFQLETKLAMTEERLEQNKTNLTGTSSLNGKLKGVCSDQVIDGRLKLIRYCQTR
jgi:hypothetical protein